MTSLLEQVRNDPEVADLTFSLENDIDAAYSDVRSQQKGYADLLKRDQLLLQAAVRELARRAREQVKRHAGANSPTEYWQFTADFIERQGDE